jgi:hypothetical protein
LKKDIVLVGSEEDDHVRAVRDALRKNGVEPLVLDSLKFPNGPRLSMGPGIEETTLDDRDVGRPGAVYLRSLYLTPLAFGVDAKKDMDEDWRTTLVIFREKAEVLLSVCRRWEALDVPIYNPITVSDAVRKPYQMSLLANAGLPVPRTLWSNDPQAVLRFSAGERVAYKPVAGGAATRELAPEDLTERRLSSLSNAAVTFQELLPGTDMRAFVLDGKIISAYRIVTDPPLDTDGDGQLNDCPNPSHNAKGTSNTDELSYCSGGSQAGKLIGAVSGTTTSGNCTGGGGNVTSVTNGVSADVDGDGTNERIYGHPQACTWNAALSDSCDPPNSASISRVLRAGVLT